MPTVAGIRRGGVSILVIVIVIAFSHPVCVSNSVNSHKDQAGRGRRHPRNCHRFGAFTCCLRFKTDRCRDERARLKDRGTKKVAKCCHLQYLQPFQSKQCCCLRVQTSKRRKYNLFCTVFAICLGLNFQ